MLFYVSLFLFCVVLAGISLWMVRSLRAVGKAVYRAFLPSSKGKVRELKQPDQFSINEARVPWGWSGRHAQRQVYAYEPDPELERTEYSGPAPWGWPGNRYNHERGRVHEVRFPAPLQRVKETARDVLGQGRPGSARRRVGWPYRAEGFEYAGQKKTVERARGKSNGGSVRPWGW